MKIRITLAASALFAMTLVASPAQATISPSATDAGTWLAGQLTGGLIHNDQYGFDDYGLTLDVLMALQEADTQGPKQGAIVSAIGANIKQYVYNYPNTAPSDGVYAGSAAKALVAVQAAGKNGASFGGIDLVSTVENTVETSGADKGRLKDRDVAGYPDPSVPADYSNLLYQAYGLQGLAAAHSSAVDDVRDFLLKQQCGPGYFRLYYDACKADTDATSIAVRAMTAAKADGVTGLDGALSKATSWLVGQQRKDGSFGGGESTPDSNVNSTGLASSALVLRGKTAAAEKAAAWIYALQVKPTTAGKLAHEDGAVALAKDGFDAGLADGITSATSDQWRRATSQAIYGLIHLDPATIDEKIVDRVKIVVPKPLVRTVTGAAPVVNAAEDVPVGADSAAGRLGQYLAGQFSNGDHIEVKNDGTTFVDYDLTAAATLALRQLGQQAKFADRATAFLLDKASVRAYAHGAPYEKKASYADPLAKLLIAGKLAGKTDAKTAVGLAGDLAGLQQADGSFVDAGKYPDRGNATERQATAALALRMAGNGAAADKAVAYIEKSQCKDGSFPRQLGKPCGASDPAATGWALQAINAVATDDRTGSLADAPRGWDPAHSQVVVKAADSLRSSVQVDGSVDGADLIDTAAVSAGRQAAGLDASATAHFLMSLQKKDGGLPETVGGKKSVLGASVGVAPALSATSWLSTPGSGLVSAVSLPLGQPVAAHQASHDSAKSDDFTVARPVAYAGGGVLALIVLAALGLGTVGLRRSGRRV